MTNEQKKAKSREYHERWKAKDPERARRLRNEAWKAWAKSHRDSVNRTSAKWKRNNPEKLSASRRRYNLRRKLRLLGIDAEWYQRTLARQGASCAICKNQESSDRKTRLSIDHNHTTGHPRGLLCHGCNVSLGLMKDDPMRLRNAIAYLEGSL